MFQLWHFQRLENTFEKGGATPAVGEQRHLAKQVPSLNCSDKAASRSAESPSIKVRHRWEWRRPFQFLLIGILPGYWLAGCSFYLGNVGQNETICKSLWQHSFQICLFEFGKFCRKLAVLQVFRPERTAQHVHRLARQICCRSICTG